MRSETVRCGIAAAGLIGAVSVVGARSGVHAPAERARSSSPAPIERARETLPVRFEANAGQFDARVAFVGRARNALLALTDDAATLALPGAGTALRWRVEGGRRVRPLGSDALPTRSNYFIGPDPARWRVGVPNFARVTYPGVLEGVDLVYHGDGGRLEYDLVVAPNADATGLAMAVEGAQGLSLDAAGNLVIATARGALVQPAPRVYQQNGGGGQDPVRAAYRLLDDRRVAFEVAPYDPMRALVIDPVIAYATYLGGGAYDEAQRVGVDAAGSAYLAGVTSSVNFPLKDAFDPTFTGDTHDAVFVAKLDPSGSALVYATYVGGAGDAGVSLMSAFAVDPNGHAFVAGSPSADFPLKGAMQASGNQFLLKLAQNGGLAYSTRFGGSGADAIFGLAADGSGSAYLTGETGSADFPTKGALYPSFQGGDYDAFVAKVTPAGTTLAFSTYLGSPGTDSGHAIGFDGAGRVYVTGETNSASFPVKGAPQAKYGGGESDAFIASLAGDGASLLYATFLGGSGAEVGDAIAVDAPGNAYVTGVSMVGGVTGPVANDFPFTPGALDIPFANNFTAKLRPGGGSFVYAALGPGGGDLAIDATGNAYLGLSCGYNVVNPNGSNTSPFQLDPTGQNCPSAMAMALDSAANVYLVGSAADGGIAPSPGALQKAFAGGAIDAFAMKIGSNALPDAGIHPDGDDAGANASVAASDAASARPPDDAGALGHADATLEDSSADAATVDRDAGVADGGAGGTGGGTGGGTPPGCSLGQARETRPCDLVPFAGLALVGLRRRRGRRPR